MSEENQGVDVLIKNANLINVGRSLSRREQFAMAAMQGLCAWGDKDGAFCASEIASASVIVADLTIKELDKDETTGLHPQGKATESRFEER